MLRAIADTHAVVQSHSPALLTHERTSSTPEARLASQDFLKDETIIAVLPFEIRKLPNRPIVPLKIGEVSFLGSFDTGQLGGVYLNKATRAKLEKQRLLAPKVGGDEPTFDLNGLAFTPSFTASVMQFKPKPTFGSAKR
jgi:hypothetical protein